MSADVSILLSFAGDGLLKPLRTLLLELLQGGRIETPQVRHLVDRSGTSSTKGEANETDEPLTLDEDVWSRPDIAEGRAVVWASFLLSSGRTVSTYVVAQCDRARFRVPSARFCFVRDDTMDVFARSWNGEKYLMQGVLPAIREWEADCRELFTLLCASGAQNSVEHAIMSMDSDWVGPEACSMVFHADAREIMIDVLRCRLSMAHSVPMSELFDVSRPGQPLDSRLFSGPRRSDEYLAIVGLGNASDARHFLDSMSIHTLQAILQLGARDVAALVELATAEHARRVRELEQDLLRRNPPLEGIGMTRTIARAASVEGRWMGDGLALMTNPLSTLLLPYQLIYQSFASINEA